MKNNNRQVDRLKPLVDHFRKAMNRRGFKVDSLVLENDSFRIVVEDDEMDSGSDDDVKVVLQVPDDEPADNSGKDHECCPCVGAAAADDQDDDLDIEVDVDKDGDDLDLDLEVDDLDLDMDVDDLVGAGSDDDDDEEEDEDSRPRLESSRDEVVRRIRKARLRRRINEARERAFGNNSRPVRENSKTDRSDRRAKLAAILESRRRRAVVNDTEDSSDRVAEIVKRARQRIEEKQQRSPLREARLRKVRQARLRRLREARRAQTNQNDNQRDPDSTLAVTADEKQRWSKLARLNK